MESPTPLPVAAGSPSSMADAASGERCVQSSDEPRREEDTGGDAANSGGVDVSMREPSLQQANGQSQREWEMFGPPPPPDDDGDLGWELEDEFKDKCVITIYPPRKSEQGVREPAGDLIEEPPRGRQSETDMQEQAEVDRNSAEGESGRFVSSNNEAAEEAPRGVVEEVEASHATGGSRASSFEAETSANAFRDSAPLTTMMAADRLRELGYPAFSVDITWDREKGKKSFKFPTSWQTSTLANGIVRQNHNCLAINTNTCDLLGVDIDTHDGGMAAWEALQNAHGPVTAPSVRTGSGGVHLYFSHNKSLAAGLSASIPTTFSKLYVDSGDGAVSKVGIDLRGKGLASCLIAPGSSYVDGTGARVGYEVIGESELPPITDRGPLPG
ncbi:hypothetical protein KFL_011960020 [Klebsormidium nitens]|uniref:DNA primase/polymerase bifunctional N-terminal domain-containing protein n=1 Tax=Klebsormidium nitens TaxID=105231 RepID=A0A1Y1ITL1_KLENI|nr:hypothetical protein KFL_011960020 [Klebsormidium nitens]|eukprot:GAQ92909.1 hypothetical protein KFL_011960020 [Klebsormidium nitens]